jgi:Transposase
MLVHLRCTIYPHYSEKTQNKVPLGFVEGLNNKIPVIQRRAYGLRDEK